MAWTPLFLQMADKKVLIIGSGEVGERRALRFLKAGAEVVIIGGTLSKDIQYNGAVSKPRDELEKWIEWCDLVIIASGDTDFNNKVASLSGEKLINRADNPFEGNLIIPTTFSVGEAQISIYTGGKSPLMARMLRKKIQAAITEEDILQIELQDYARNKLKIFTNKQRLRRHYLYKILNNSKIRYSLEKGNLKEAKSQVDTLIENMVSNGDDSF
ncbi:precorrin-2 dehydrogenase/sirohydrochlorin ferrochelatase family protein [Methanobacterium alcaliphilum]|uniref:precorrin-2 dehydrogenase/sirohydrochlorin ferrochelatase family protein n=1 Tax=Methanobacterium alcaliphilum TaxID=392018 RepID=UPI002009FA77|nr:bifunctional precorrin-2 dehydrogenase/sirohydrochlorin ferrochelatase [Methanobacterium alcaliphilum]MCK9150375.1 bifunctional precorrin-2 dehydrogenase/sirohydrochlorin ferrochelatase [Methanobacterium alcaliphilum]